MSLRRYFSVFVVLLALVIWQVPVFADDPPVTVGANLAAYQQPTGGECNINVPSQYSTIQAGINAAASGDTVCVSPGTYNEDVTINKSIRLSGSGASSSIINGQTAGDTVVVAGNGVADDVILEGFFIRGINGVINNDPYNAIGSSNATLSLGTYVAGATIRYNQIVAGNQILAVRADDGQAGDLFQNNIFEGSNSPGLFDVTNNQVPSGVVDVLNNTFTGSVPTTGPDVNAGGPSDGIVLGGFQTNSLIEYNAFHTTGTTSILVQCSYPGDIVSYNNFSAPAAPLQTMHCAGPNAENNWWGDTDPTDQIWGFDESFDYAPFASSPFPEYSISSQVTSLSPAKVWIGLKNSDDVGLKFDLKAEAYVGNTLVSSGELDSFAGGSSGFNHAHLASIAFNSFSPLDFQIGSQLKLKLYVRNACTGSGHTSGTARLWYNDSQANSQFDATIGSADSNYYLLDNFIQGSNPGSTKKTVDVSAGAKCSAFKSFGTWTLSI